MNKLIFLHKFGKNMAIVCFGSMAAFISHQSQAAALITFDLRATTLNGVSISGSNTSKNVTVTSPSDVVGFQLFADINSTNSTQTDDGFLQAMGSFFSTVSSGNLTGTLLGTAVPSPFNGATAQIGTNTTDQNGGGGVDVGLIAGDSSLPTPNPYYVTVSNTNSVILGTQAVAGSLEFLIGGVQFTYASGSGTTTIQFTPRVTSAVSKPNKFTIDGVSKSITGTVDNVNISLGSAVNITTIPEPSTWFMMLSGMGFLFGIQRFQRNLRRG